MSTNPSDAPTIREQVSDAQGGRRLGLRYTSTITQALTEIGQTPGAGTNCTAYLQTLSDTAYDNASILFAVEMMGHLTVVNTQTLSPAANAAQGTVEFTYGGVGADAWYVYIQLASGARPAKPLQSALIAYGVENTYDPNGGGGGGGLDQLTGDVLAGPGTGSQAAKVVGARNMLLSFAATGSIDYAASAALPGIRQIAPASDVAPADLLFEAQDAFTGALTNLQGADVVIRPGLGDPSQDLSGNVIVRIPQQNTAIGTSGAFQIEVNGAQTFQVWSYDGITTGLWLGPNNDFIALSRANLYTDGGVLQVGGNGGVILENAGINIFNALASGGGAYTSPGFNLAVGGIVAGGATNVFGIAYAGSVPVADAFGDVFYVLPGGELHVLASSGGVAPVGFDQIVAPQVVGTPGAQALSDGPLGFAQTTVGAGTFSMPIPIPTGPVCNIMIRVIGRRTVIGTSGGAVGDGITGTFIAGIGNPTGTPAVLGGAAPTPIMGANDASFTSHTAPNGTFAPNLFTFEILVDATQGTVEWEAVATTLAN